MTFVTVRGGIRVKKEEDTAGSNVVLYSMYAGNNPVIEEKYDGATLIETRFNIYDVHGWTNAGPRHGCRKVGAGSSVLGHIRKVYGVSEEFEYFCNDNLGSRRVVLDAAGVVTDKFTYSAYGEVTHVSGTNGELASFTGKGYDSTGLLYFNARYYDPVVGRFLTEDPSMDGINRYSYVGNNPVNLVDPTGLRSAKDDYDYPGKNDSPKPENDNDHDDDDDVIINYFAEGDIPITVSFGGNDYILGDDINIGASVPKDSVFNVPKDSDLELGDNTGNRYRISDVEDLNLKDALDDYKKRKHDDLLNNQKRRGIINITAGVVEIAGGIAAAPYTSGASGLWVVHGVNNIVFGINDIVQAHYSNVNNYPSGLSMNEGGMFGISTYLDW